MRPLSHRRSAIDQCTIQHEGYRAGQRKKRIEEVFAWMKTVGLLRIAANNSVSFHRKFEAQAKKPPLVLNVR